MGSVSGQTREQHTAARLSPADSETIRRAVYKSLTRARGLEAIAAQSHQTLTATGWDVCPVCYRMCSTSPAMRAQCGNVIPPQVKAARIKAGKRMAYAALGFDGHTRYQERTQPHPRGRAYKVTALLLSGETLDTVRPSTDDEHAMDLRRARRQHVETAMSDAEAARLRWTTQREHLDIDEPTEYDDHLGIVGARDIDETPEPQQPPPEPPDVGCLIAAPRPGPSADVALAVG